MIHFFMFYYISCRRIRVPTAATVYYLYACVCIKYLK